MHICLKLFIIFLYQYVKDILYHRSFHESGDTSYELASVQQPEVTTMIMNGREVVVIDSELFSQIIDEIQLLKMKLSQLTDVIQVDYSSIG